MSRENEQPVVDNRIEERTVYALPDGTEYRSREEAQRRLFEIEALEIYANTNPCCNGDALLQWMRVNPKTAQMMLTAATVPARYFRCRVPDTDIEIEFDTHTLTFEYHQPLEQWRSCGIVEAVNE